MDLALVGGTEDPAFGSHQEGVPETLQMLLLWFSTPSRLP